MSARRRRLVDAAARACGLPAGTWTGEVLPVDPLVVAHQAPRLSPIDPLAQRSTLTSSSRTHAGAGLETLVLVAQYEAEPQRRWMLSGWDAIRLFGRDLDLAGARLTAADLAGADLRRTDLSEADLSRADLTKADLTGANLTGACLAGATLFSASLKDADLSEADLSRTDLRHADLRGATCQRTAFRGADLWGTYMWRVDVSNAFVDGADLGRSDYLAEEVQP